MTSTHKFLLWDSAFYYTHIYVMASSGFDGWFGITKRNSVSNEGKFSAPTRIENSKFTANFSLSSSLSSFEISGQNESVGQFFHSLKNKTAKNVSIWNFKLSGDFFRLFLRPVELEEMQQQQHVNTTTCAAHLLLLKRSCRDSVSGGPPPKGLDFSRCLIIWAGQHISLVLVVTSQMIVNTKKASGG